MTPLEVRQFLDSFVNYELNLGQISSSDFTLERVLHLLKLLGSPHKKIKALHVAGTKGKGSTCVFTAHILRRAGYHVGLYTSPHILDVKERIRVLSPLVPFRPDLRDKEIFSDSISEKELAAVLQETKPALEKMRSTKKYGCLTYFEVLTVLAFCYFVRKKVDYVVLETGLGGRLDATNVVDPLACAITPISLEHTKILGNTVSEIAKEKAAIIKNENQVVVVAPQDSAALAVIKKRCAKIGAKAYFVGKNIKVRFGKPNENAQSFSVKSFFGKTYYLKTDLLGRHQAQNAATAIALVEALACKGAVIDDKAVVQGIAETFWPGRFEILRHEPTIILDSAHNPASAEQLTKTVAEIYPNKKIVVILGLSQDKDRGGICRKFLNLDGKFILTKANHARAHEFSDKEMMEIFKGRDCYRTKNISEALKLALTKVKKNGVILVTGSIFLVGEARKIAYGV